MTASGAGTIVLRALAVIFLTVGAFLAYEGGPMLAAGTPLAELRFVLGIVCVFVFLSLVQRVWSVWRKRSH